MDEQSRRSFGAIRQLPSGRYQAHFKLDEVRHNAPVTFPTRTAAERWLRDAWRDLDDGKFVDPKHGRTDFLTYGRTVLDAHKLGLEPGSASRYESSWRSLVAPYFADCSLAELAADPARFRKWAVDRSLAGTENGSIQQAGQLIALVLDTAVSDRLIAANPTNGITWPAPKSREMETIVVRQIDQLAETIDRRYRSLVLVACYAGLRLGELTALTVGDVNPLRRTITVTKSVVVIRGHFHKGPPKSAAGRRTIPIPRWLADELAEEFAGRHRDDIAWPAPRGGYLRPHDLRRRYWYPAVKAIGRPDFRIHDMRHTAVSLWIAAGVDVKRIALWAGHKNTAYVLDRYGHLFSGQDAEAIDRLDALIAAQRAETSNVIALPAR